jgi:uncharacterized membrane protein YdjX (TVP38/TMEM64 family)
MGRYKLENHFRLLKTAVELHRNNLFWYLVTLRVFPFTPNWLLNIAAPHLGIGPRTFFFSMLAGCVPYIFICAEGGSILHLESRLNSAGGIMNSHNLMKLTILSFLSLFLALFKHLKVTKWP